MAHRRLSLLFKHEEIWFCDAFHHWELWVRFGLQIKKSQTPCGLSFCTCPWEDQICITKSSNQTLCSCVSLAQIGCFMSAFASNPKSANNRCFLFNHLSNCSQSVLDLETFLERGFLSPPPKLQCRHEGRVSTPKLHIAYIKQNMPSQVLLIIESQH